MYVEFTLATLSILFEVATTSSYPCMRDPEIISVNNSIPIRQVAVLKRVCTSQRKNTVSCGTSFAIGMDGQQSAAGEAGMKLFRESHY